MTPNIINKEETIRSVELEEEHVLEQEELLIIMYITNSRGDIRA